jgi:hypothetical protein
MDRTVVFFLRTVVTCSIPVFLATVVTSVDIVVVTVLTIERVSKP